MMVEQFPLKTKRVVFGHLMVCSGCCCGAVGRGKPEVPVDWLKQEWRRLGLLKKIQLSISRCLGPCDLPNVVRIAGLGSDVWLGSIRDFVQYGDLVAWASKNRAAGVLLPLPETFDPLPMNPFLTPRAALDPGGQGK